MRHLFAIVPITLLGIGSAPVSARTFAPSEHGLDELVNIERLAQLRDGVRCRMESTYDRDGGNDDGFNGTYSRLRAEGNDSVLFETEGAGRIQRFWMPYTNLFEDFLLDGKSEHIRFYLDGEDKPRIDIPIRNLFNGEHPAFPLPLVGKGNGGHYCYVPITYSDGCRVVIDGAGARFWQLTYSQFDSAKGLTTFSVDRPNEEQLATQRAIRAWSELGKSPLVGIDPRHTRHQDLALAMNEIAEVHLPKGPHIIRAIVLTGSSEELANARDAQVEVYWNKKDVYDYYEHPSIVLPLSYLFGNSNRGGLFRSLLMGTELNRWYCFLPMPYSESARITIRANKAVDAKLSVNVKPLDEWDEGRWGYLHARWHQELPTTPGRQYPWLHLDEARGHYVGTVLDTEGVHPGNRWLPTWLEGDETFQIDGELDIHGTGSEDYFNCGWYGVPKRLDNPGTFPLHGYTSYFQGPPSTYATSYRWHLSDPIPFGNSIRAQIEVGPTNNVQANYKSAVFYYLDRP